MMNFYIVSNDRKEQRILKKIIEANFNNSILGITNNPEEAYQEAMRLSIDIIFIAYDIDNPMFDGLQLMKKIRDSHHHPHFIVMAHKIASVTKSQIFVIGADYVLEEPLNLEETKKIIRLTVENIRMSRRLLKIQDLVLGAANRHTQSFDYKTKQENKAQAILRFLGIASGISERDITKITNVMIEKEATFKQISIEKIYSCSAAQKKVILQRIRRDLKKGLRNLAYIFNSDSADGQIIEYANNLFGFENVQHEIMLLKNQRKVGGSIVIEQFFNGLVQESE